MRYAASLFYLDLTQIERFCPQVLGAAMNFMFNIFNGFVITYSAIPVWW